MEVDPLIQRALTYLISRKPDSSEKLKQMLFESLGREYAPPPVTDSKLIKVPSDSVMDVDTEDDNTIDNESTDLDEAVAGVDDSVDADDFAFDMGISCIKCRQFDVSSNNQLLECQECHSLYHQQCHSPAVNDSAASAVWFCYKCDKSSSPATTTHEKTKKSDISNDKTVSSEGESSSSKKLDKGSGSETKKSELKKSKSDKQKSGKKAKDIKDKTKSAEKSEKPKKHKLSDKEKDEHTKSKSKADAKESKKLTGDSKHSKTGKPGEKDGGESEKKAKKSKK